MCGASVFVFAVLVVSTIQEITATPSPFRRPPYRSRPNMRRDIAQLDERIRILESKVDQVNGDLFQVNQTNNARTDVLHFYWTLELQKLESQYNQLAKKIKENQQKQKPGDSNDILNLIQQIAAMELLNNLADESPNESENEILISESREEVFDVDVSLEQEPLQTDYDSSTADNDVSSDFISDKDDSSDEVLEIEETEATTSETPPEEDQVISNCKKAMEGHEKSGIYQFNIPKSGLPVFDVYCQVDHRGYAPWTVVMRRRNGLVSFDRGFEDYENGFGDLKGEFFIGLDKLHALTNQEPQTLWILVEDEQAAVNYAKYQNFAIGDKNHNYSLNDASSYSGNVGDALSPLVGTAFSTKDDDVCPEEHRGGWWYSDCNPLSNLNGLYGKTENGIVWNTWHGPEIPIKKVLVAIRPSSSKVL